MSAEQLIARMHAARERRIELFTGRSVTVRRPSDLEFLAFIKRDEASGESALDIPRERIFDSVVAWAGFTEADLVPSGASDTVPFDRAVWLAWIADHPAHWAALAETFTAMVIERSQSRDGAEKN